MAARNPHSSAELPAPAIEGSRTENTVHRYPLGLDLNELINCKSQDRHPLIHHHHCSPGITGIGLGEPGLYI